MSKICSVSECGKVHLAKGFCKIHYWRSKYAGYIDLPPKAEPKKCKAPSCNELCHAREYCHRHYVKIMRTGTLERVVFGHKWKEAQQEGQKTELSKLDRRPDTRPGKRGTFANNTVNEIKSKAINRKIGWNLSAIETYYLIIGECKYCGHNPNWPETRNGIDRIDSSNGYIKDNCVSCCFTCNSAKNNQSVKQFLEWIVKVYNKTRTFTVP